MSGLLDKLSPAIRAKKSDDLPLFYTDQSMVLRFDVLIISIVRLILILCLTVKTLAICFPSSRPLVVTSGESRSSQLCTSSSPENSSGVDYTITIAKYNGSSYLPSPSCAGIDVIPDR